MRAYPANRKCFLFRKLFVFFEEDVARESVEEPACVRVVDVVVRIEVCDVETQTELERSNFSGATI